MIDRNIIRPWPPEVRAAAARFKQGDVISNPGFFYTGVPGHAVWGLTATAPANSTPELFELDAEDSPEYGIITTQTCDIDEQRPKPRQPWLQLAPVYRADDFLDRGQQRQVELWMTGHLVRVTGATFSTGFWVADLRIQFPVEKSVLVGRDPIDGFTSEDEYLRFADHLARRFGRPAIADIVSNLVVSDLRQSLDALKGNEREEVLGGVVELRLQVTPTRLSAQAAQLIVVVRGTRTREATRVWFDTWWENLQARADDEGLAVLHNRYAVRGSLTDLEYFRSAELDFRYLSPMD